MKNHSCILAVAWIVFNIFCLANSAHSQAPELHTENLDSPVIPAARSTYRQLLGAVGDISAEAPPYKGTVILSEKPSARRILEDDLAVTRAKFSGKVAAGVADVRETTIEGRKYLWLIILEFDPTGACSGCDEWLLAVFELRQGNAELIDKVTVESYQDLSFGKNLRVSTKTEALTLNMTVSNVTSLNSVSVISIRDGRISVLLSKFPIRNVYRCDQSVEETATLRMLPAGKSRPARLEIIVRIVAAGPVEEGGDAQTTFRRRVRYVFSMNRVNTELTPVINPAKSHRRMLLKNSPCGVLPAGF